MKSQADKLISEKLSSLDSLPEGYSPNIDSKWAIVQGSIAKDKPVNYKLWIGIAACLLILLATSIMLKQINTPSIVVEEPRPKKLMHTENTTANNAVASPAVEQRREISTPASGKHKVKNGMKADTPSFNQPVLHDVSPENVPVIENEVAIAEPVPAVKKKQRYFEMDFDDPEQQNREVADGSPSPSVKIKLGIKTETFNNGYSVSNKPLRIRQNF